MKTKISNNSADSYRAVITPVKNQTSRPLWSVMIPTYNCANYLRETLISVISQAPSPEIMQIEVIDDCSTQGDPKTVVEDIGKARIGFYRQPENVGHVRNFQTCLERAQGKLIHILHGDDGVRHGFYQKMQQAFESHPEIGAAFCRQIYMDEYSHWQYITPLEQAQSGILQNCLERLAVEQRIQPPSIVVRRNIYEKLGGFDRRILYWGEDWEMWLRIATHYQVWYEVEPLALYRQHSSSLSGRSMRTGENIQDIRRAVSIVKQYLPDNCADRLSQAALEHWAFEALKFARNLASMGDSKAAFNQVREALLCSSSSNVIRPSLKLILKIFYQMTIQHYKKMESPP
jgi:glycosyltransferase involved in cell wall biosynthesis